MEPLSNNFTFTEKSSTSILLKFWGYFWLQDFRGSKKGSIYVCRNLPMSHLVQFKAWKWGFGWFSNLQAWKTWIFQISRVAHKVWWILGAPIWAPKSQKFYFHKLQKKLKIFQFYHVYSKCTIFDVQPQIAKCNQIPYYDFDEIPLVGWLKKFRNMKYDIWNVEYEIFQYGIWKINFYRALNN